MTINFSQFLSLSKIVYVVGCLALIIQVTSTLVRLSSLTQANFELSELRQAEKSLQTKLGTLQSRLAETRVDSFQNSTDLSFVPIQNTVVVLANNQQVAAR